jgi:hypothetical protein
VTKYFILLSIVLFLRCSDFAYEQKIVGNYYLIGVDTKTDISISLKLKSGDFIGRIERVKQYTVVNDSLIFARSLDTANKSVYYILNMNKDFDVAKIENIIIGPIDSETFNNYWAKKFKIKFISISD